MPEQVEGVLTIRGAVPQISLIRSSRMRRMEKVSSNWMASACP